MQASASPLNRGLSRNRGRKTSRTPRRHIDLNAERVPAPSAGTILPPALTTVKEAPMNEPLALDEFFIEGSILHPVRVSPLVSISHAGYQDLINVSYIKLRSTNRHLCNNVPESVYSYYMWQLLHARLNEVALLQGTPSDIVLGQIFSNRDFQVPKIINRYLQSIGKFTTPSGTKFGIAPLHIPVQEDGSYGIFTPETSVAYQQAAAPCVTTQRMQQDADQETNGNWDLDATVNPAPVNNRVLTPTANLLGYQRTRVFRGPEANAFTSFDITPDTMPADTTTKYQTSNHILVTVSSYLKANDKLDIMETFEPGSVTGSASQGLSDA